MTAVPGYGEVFGATIPAPIWQEFMLAAHGSKCDDFPRPKTPFVPRPFSGHYETGRGSSGSPTGSTGFGTTGTVPPASQAPPPASGSPTGGATAPAH